MPVILTEQVKDESAWRGPDFANDDSWIHHLTPQWKEEIEHALNQVQQKGVPMLDMTKEDFPLPTFSKEIEKIVNEIEGGRGFVLIRGLNVDDYTEEQASIIYLGIGSHMGIKVSQNGKGHMLGHVRDLGKTYMQSGTRGYETTARLGFHADSSDVVGLLCLKTGKSGGESRIVSSVAIFNEIAEKHPEYLGLLFSGIVADWQGNEQPEGFNPVYKYPIYSYYDGKLSCKYVRSAFELAPKKTGINLSAAELEVLEYVDTLANSDQFYLEMGFQKGDMQFLNNYTCLHSRTEYEDYEELEQKRHLLRLWLTLFNGRELSPDFCRIPGDTVITERGRGGVWPKDDYFKKWKRLD